MKTRICFQNQRSPTFANAFRARRPKGWPSHCRIRLFEMETRNIDIKLRTRPKTMRFFTRGMVAKCGPMIRFVVCAIAVRKYGVGLDMEGESEIGVFSDVYIIGD